MITLTLWHTAALNAWDKIQESEKSTGPFTKILQGLKEAFSEFLQRLTSSVNRMIAYLEVKQILIEPDFWEC